MKSKRKEVDKGQIARSLRSRGEEFGFYSESHQKPLEGFLEGSALISFTLQNVISACVQRWVVQRLKNRRRERR